MQVEASLATELKVLTRSCNFWCIGCTRCCASARYYGRSMYGMEVLAIDPVLDVYVPVALYADQVAMGFNVPDD